MTNRISEIKNTIGAGARSNKFRVYFSFPDVIDISTTGMTREANVLCFSSSLPERTVGQIEVWNLGRKLIIPGDTTFQNNWDCQFYNTEEHNLRRAFLAWQKACDHAETGTHTGDPSAVMTTMKIVQLDSAENETVVYELHNVYPNVVSSIEMDQASESTAIEQFTVTFSYTDWVVGTDENNDQPSMYNSATRNAVSLNN